jgi:hypothetical protein
MTQFRDRVGLPRVMKFIERKLAEYDTSELEYVTLSPMKTIRGPKHDFGHHGYCYYPKSKDRKKEKYYITTAVRLDLKYPFSFVHWCRRPDPNYQQGWVTDSSVFTVYSVEELACHTLAHECFHFLSKSRQIKHKGQHVKNVEANANHYADLWLKEFRESLHEDSATERLATSRGGG